MMFIMRRHLNGLSGTNNFNNRGCWPCVDLVVKNKESGVMKILTVHSALNPDTNKQSQVDHWRIYRPMRELAKHVDWKIDYQPSFIKGIEKFQKLEEFTSEEMEKAFKVISSYDIVFASYHPDPTAYTLLKVAADKTGTQFIMDCDDDMFAINPDNPFWMKMTHEKVYQMQCMIRDNTWISTTTEALANTFRERRVGHHKDTVFVNPNRISNDYKHPDFDNGDKIVIGYFGGSSHYADLHDSGALDAIQNIMHENRNVHFKSVGMIVDKYIPKHRLIFDGGKRGTKWMDEIFPTLQMDVAIAPLVDNIFNKGKSDIKWQEATRAGAAFVGTAFGPYSKLLPGTAKVVKNTYEDWYTALKELIDNKELRQQQVKFAREYLKGQTLEKNWQGYKAMFEKVKELKDANRKPRTKTIIL